MSSGGQGGLALYKGLSLQSHLQVLLLLFSLYLGQQRGLNKHASDWSASHNNALLLANAMHRSLSDLNWKEWHCNIKKVMKYQRKYFTCVNKILIDYSQRCLFWDSFFPHSLFACLKMINKEPPWLGRFSLHKQEKTLAECLICFSPLHSSHSQDTLIDTHRKSHISKHFKHHKCFRKLTCILHRKIRNVFINN